MLETLRQVPFFLNRHREAPLLRERGIFLRHLEQQGTSRNSLLSISNELLHIVRLLCLDTMRNVSLDEIRRAAERFELEEQSNPRARSYGHTASFFPVRREEMASLPRLPEDAHSSADCVRRKPRSVRSLYARGAGAFALLRCLTLLEDFRVFALGRRPSPLAGNGKSRRCR